MNNMRGQRVMTCILAQRYLDASITFRPQDAENDRQLRSHLENILNVPLRVRRRCFRRLRPRWTVILRILRNSFASN